ncbi:MAG: gliding motility-associated C-terminal domain-containing protein, partial [Bacteroidota bacterium]
TYFWDANTNFATSSTVDNLAPGTYNVTVTDDNGCTEIGSATINQPNPISLATTSTAADCNGAANGSATVQVNGGSGSYMYAWNDPNGQTTATANGLAIGDYEVTVTDLNSSCEAMTTVRVDAPNPILLQEQVTMTRCNNTNDGSINLNINGGSGNYNINWADDPTTSTMRDNLAPGLYEVTVSDDNNCTTSAQILVPNPNPITSNIFSTENSCRPVADGTATINASGGTGVLSYQWDDPQMQQTNRAVQLVAGNYTVTVTDANNCQITATVDVDDAPPIQFRAITNMPSCFGDVNGYVEIDATGGVGDLSYRWQGLTNETTNRLQNVGAGTYDVIISDDLGCEVTASTTLAEPAELTATNSVSTTSCNGVSDGNASVVPSGGTAPYSYQWNDPNSQTTATATGLDPQVYSVTITDANNCTIIKTVDVATPDRLTVTATTVAASCANATNGSATATPNGGSGGYTYQWNAGNDPTKPTAEGLSAGTYSVTVTDANGCTATTTVTVEQDDPFTITTTITDENCLDLNAGAIDITVNQAAEPLTYEWSNGETTEDLSDLTAGSYTGTITDANGCEVTLSADVNAAPSLDLSFDTSDATCKGGTDGRLNVNAAGGAGGYFYQWADGSIDSVRTSLMAGTYTVEAISADGCRKIDSVAIQEPDSVLLALRYEPISCFSDRNAILVATATGGQPQYAYSLDNQRYGFDNTFTNLTAGTYSIVAQDENSCFSEPVEITIPQPEELTVSMDRLFTYQLGDSVQLEPKINGGTGDLLYSWTPADSTLLSCLDCPNPTVTTSFQTSVVLTVTDENNCQTSVSTQIIVEKNRNVLVPTGFTPDDNGTNDRLVVHGDPKARVKYFRVLDRWGELLYERNNFMVNDTQMGWDGTFRGKNAPAGVYIWYLEVEFVDGAEVFYKGTTTLIR